MKRKILFTGLLLTTLLVGTYVSADTLKEDETLTEFKSEKAESDISDGVFSDKYINIKLQIELLIEKNELRTEQGDSFLAKVESAKTTQELDAIWEEVEQQIKTNQSLTEWGFAEVYLNLKNNIELLVKKGELTTEQGDTFLAKVESAKTTQELDAIWKDVQQQVKTNQSLTEWGFSEAYINLKNNIELLVKNGELTEEQGDMFLAKVESAQTRQELDTIWEEVQQQVETNKTTTISSTVKQPETDTNKKTKSANQLPKTGESKVNLSLIGIGFVAMLSSIILLFKTKRFSN